MKKIIKNMPIEKYHENKMVISSTGLKEIKKSTRHFLYYLTRQEKPKKHFDFGNAFELAIMDKVNGSDLFEKEVAVFPESILVNDALTEKPDLKVPKSSKSFKDASAKWHEAHDGKYIIADIGEKESNEALEAMVNSCLSDSTIKKLLSNTEYQNSYFWKHKTGVLCKTRPDVNKLRKNVLVDIKTCQDASQSAFARQAANLEYYLQACMQIDGAVGSGAMKQVDNYFWLAVEKEPPYNACIYELQQYDILWLMDMYHDTMQKAARAIELLKNAKDPYFSNIMGYGENADNPYGIIQVEIPLYYKYQNNFMLDNSPE